MKLRETTHCPNCERLAQAEPADEGIRVLLFQAVRELLDNIVQHAGVEHAWVEMKRLNDEQVQIVVRDEGVGFDPGNLGTSVFGLFGIRERLELLGGKLEVESSPGKGTSVSMVASFRSALRPSKGDDAATGRQAAPAGAAPAQPHPTGGGPIRVLLIDRCNSGSDIGTSLLSLSDQMFHWWRRVRDGTLARSSFQKYVGPLRHAVREQLERGAECSCKKTAGTCRKLLKQESAMWTFVWVEGVEPTNNGPERTLRHGVLWRKSSGGTDSPAGSRFVQRMLSVAATCRQQKRQRPGVPRRMLPRPA